MLVTDKKKYLHVNNYYIIFNLLFFSYCHYILPVTAFLLKTRPKDFLLKSYQKLTSTILWQTIRYVKKLYSHYKFLRNTNVQDYRLLPLGRKMRKLTLNNRKFLRSRQFNSQLTSIKLSRVITARTRQQKYLSYTISDIIPYILPSLNFNQLRFLISCGFVTLNKKILYFNTCLSAKGFILELLISRKLIYFYYKVLLNTSFTLLRLSRIPIRLLRKKSSFKKTIYLGPILHNFLNTSVSRSFFIDFPTMSIYSTQKNLTGGNYSTHHLPVIGLQNWKYIN